MVWNEAGVGQKSQIFQGPRLLQVVYLFFSSKQWEATERFKAGVWHDQTWHFEKFPWLHHGEHIEGKKMAAGRPVRRRSQ